MKSFNQPLFLAIAALLVTFVSQAQATAQEADGAGIVAVLDVAKVFKDNQGFDTKMKSIKAEADQLRGQITKQQENIKARAQSLVQYEVGSKERNDMEAQLEQENAALRTKARQAEADLLNREARIYHDTYLQMQSVVSSIASKNNIALVLRFDSEDIDPTNRAEVIKGVNRAVVYHRQLDLTTMVSGAMNQSSARAPSGTQNR